MKIELELLLLLADLYDNVPMVTPNRAELLYELASDIWQKRQQEEKIDAKKLLQ